MRRLVASLALCALLAACGTAADLDEAPVPLGDFRLGHTVVVAPNLTKGPLSREADVDEWTGAVRAAVEDRFGRYEGPRYYHFGISVEGYVLAQPGLPLVASPRSALILRLTVWDDAAGEKLNPEPRTVTVTEAPSPQTVIGSGLTQDRETQMENLAISAAKEIERWLVRQNRWEGWFGGRAANGPGPEAPASGDGAPAEAAPQARPAGLDGAAPGAAGTAG